MKKASFAGIALVFAASNAAADGPGDARLAQALFEEARGLMDQKRYAEACPKFKESQRLDPAGGTLMNLAQCHENEGKLASALDDYRDALTTARKDSRKDREQIAQQKIAALDPQVPRITVRVPHPVAPDIQVKLDTTPVGQAAWGVATPVDPGSHTVSATAPGYVYLTIHVDVHPGERRTVDVKLERETTPDGEEKPREVPVVPAGPPPKTKANPVFWTAIGVGTVGFVTSIVTGVLILTNNSAANDGCDNTRHFCKDGPSIDAHNNAYVYAWASTVSFGVSCVGFIVAMAVPSKKVIRVGQNSLGFAF